MKFVKVVSDRALSEADLWAFVPGIVREFGVVKPYSTAALSLFYGEVTYPLRGVVDVRGACGEGRVRRLVAWRMMDGEGYRVSEIIEHLVDWYFVQTHQRPGYVFMKKLSGTSEQVAALEEALNVQMLDVDWAMDKTVMVGG
jgi:hypothetical protein